MRSDRTKSKYRVTTLQLNFTWNIPLYCLEGVPSKLSYAYVDETVSKEFIANCKEGIDKPQGVECV
jgi:hypothetical protein